MSWVAGIDYSTHAIDVVLVDEEAVEEPHWYRFSLAGQDAFDRTRCVADVMPARNGIFWDDVLAIGIEHPAGKFGTGAMMRVQGAVLACIDGGLLVQPWPPAAWRKAVGLSGRATKEDVWDYARESSFAIRNADLLPNDGRDWPQDACDAYCIALATKAALEKQAA